MQVIALLVVQLLVYGLASTSVQMQASHVTSCTTSGAASYMGLASNTNARMSYN
jgi:hypothetical protein